MCGLRRYAKNIMSWVTNTILHLGLDDEGRINLINEFFKGRQEFVSVDDEALQRGWYGGYKMLEANLYLAALNNVDISDLVAHLRGIEFFAPSAVQLMVMDQEDSWFRLVNIFPEAQERDRKA